MRPCSDLGEKGERCGSERTGAVGILIWRKTPSPGSFEALRLNQRESEMRSGF